MKTIRSSRKLVKVRNTLRRAALAAVLGGELWLGFSLVAGAGRTAPREIDTPAGAAMSLGELMAAAR